MSADKVSWKTILYGLDDDCFMITDYIEIDAAGLTLGGQFYVHGDLFQVDVGTKEVTPFGRQCILYHVTRDSMFDPEE